MNASRREISPARPAGVWNWWSDRSHRYVLPIAGAGSLVLGLTLALDARAPWGAYAPLVLVALGVGTLASGLARLAVRSTPPPPAPTPAERFAAETWVICPSCTARSTQSVAPPTPGPSPAIATPGGAPLSASTGVGPEDPGNSLWRSWVPLVGRLPVELIGPVAETAYVPHRPGTPSLYEEGEPVLPHGVAENAASSPHPSTARPARELPAARRRVRPEIWAASVDAREGPEIRGAAVPPDGEPSIPAARTGDPVLREALNPMPPHRRPGPNPATHRGTARKERVLRPVQIDRCANCDDPVLEPTNWRRCAVCRSTLCSECIVSALVTHERGWCARCTELEEFDALATALLPRPRPPTERASSSPSTLSFPPSAGGERSTAGALAH